MKWPEKRKGGKIRVLETRVVREVSVPHFGGFGGYCGFVVEVFEGGWSGRSTARAAVGGEFPVRTLSVVRRVPSSAIAHVSASPLCHPGRSDFPSPVGDHNFPPTAFPYPTRLKRSLAFTPLGCGLPSVSTKLALSPHSQVLSPVRWALPCPSWPRVPSPFPGITLPGAASKRLEPALPGRLRSYGLMRQTWMLRGPSLSLSSTVFAGCCEPLLQTGPSRHYLCNPCPGAWTPTRQRSPGALARFFPGDIGLTSQRTRSARQWSLQSNFHRGHISGLQSFTHVQAPPLARPPGCPRRFLGRTARPFTPRIARFVTCPEMWYRYVCERAIHTAGLSPAGLQPCRLLPSACRWSHRNVHVELNIKRVFW